MKRQIYLDNAATTKILPEAMAEYVRVSEELWGNPSSLHSLGSDAERVITAAKQTILDTMGAKDSELVFTASGTEANNLAIIGRALSKERYRNKAKIITTLGEHASVTEPLEHLRRMGFTVVALSTKDGKIDMDELNRELTPDVILVSVMMVNNETGAVYNIPAVARAMKAKCPEAILHVDATQGYMKIPFTKSGIGADLITISAHKIGGRIRRRSGIRTSLGNRKRTRHRGICDSGKHRAPSAEGLYRGYGIHSSLSRGQARER